MIVYYKLDSKTFIANYEKHIKSREERKRYPLSGLYADTMLKRYIPIARNWDILDKIYKCITLSNKDIILTTENELIAVSELYSEGVRSNITENDIAVVEQLARLVAENTKYECIVEAPTIRLVRIDTELLISLLIRRGMTSTYYENLTKHDFEQLIINYTCTIDN